jgi:hypothetical protein
MEKLLLSFPADDVPRHEPPTPRSLSAADIPCIHPRLLFDTALLNEFHVAFLRKDVPGTGLISTAEVWCQLLIVRGVILGNDCVGKRQASCGHS